MANGCDMKAAHQQWMESQERAAVMASDKGVQI